MRHTNKFTKELFDGFLQSYRCGISERTYESYHYTLSDFIDYPLTTEGVTKYLNSLSCHNGKLKFYSCLRALSNWLFNSGHITDNPMKKVAPPRTMKKLLPAVNKEQLEVLQRSNP